MRVKIKNMPPKMDIEGVVNAILFVSGKSVHVDDPEAEIPILDIHGGTYVDICNLRTGRGIVVVEMV
jgi:hypothetical protein